MTFEMQGMLGMLGMRGMVLLLARVRASAHARARA
jgi:hypothetical protein